VSRVGAIGVYRPAWQSRGSRVLGPDEDMITIAVAAGRAALSATSEAVRRVVLVTAEPDYLEGAPLPVLTRALDLASGIPAELRVGGAPAALEAVANSAPGALVIGVTTGAEAAAGAALIAGSGMRVDEVATVANSVPMRVRHAGRDQASVYADGRVERERAWRPALEALGAGCEQPVLVGVPAREAKRFSSRSYETVPHGAAGSILALAAACEQFDAGRLVALDAAMGAAVTVSDADSARVISDIRPGIDAGSRPGIVGEALTIPMSMPSYDRAFEAKLTLTAMRCPQCGLEAYPRRELCLGCGRMGDGDPFALPRWGEVYSVVTVHVPVPGVWTPRDLAVVSLPPTSVRVLAHVTDQPAGLSAIGSRGALVLRLIAVREGVPDYGYAFRTEVAA
jgi:uncharacterized OB-fold protein